MATACQHCRANLSYPPRIACEAYEHVEIPETKPDITRVTLFGGACPCGAKRFKAPPPQGLEPGSARVLVEGRAEPARIRRLSALHARHLIRAAGEVFVRYSGARHKRSSTGRHEGRAGRHAGGGPRSLRLADKPDPREEPRWNRTRPGCGPANGTGGHASSTTRTAPCSGKLRMVFAPNGARNSMPASAPSSNPPAAAAIPALEAIRLTMTGMPLPNLA